MNTLIIESLFEQYVMAFEQQNIAKTLSCYQLPCTLHTPDKAVLIRDVEGFEREFSGIFEVLSQAGIKTFSSLNASYSEINSDLILACIDWQFFTQDDQLFTDFSAFYHIALIAGQWKIVNVVSQELSQSVALSIPFNISKDNSKKITE